MPFRETSNPNDNIGSSSTTDGELQRRHSLIEQMSRRISETSNQLPSDTQTTGETSSSRRDATSDTTSHTIINANDTSSDTANYETALNNPGPLRTAFGTNTVDPAIIATAREHLNAFETAFTVDDTATALTAIQDSRRSIARLARAFQDSLNASHPASTQAGPHQTALDTIQTALDTAQDAIDIGNQDTAVADFHRDLATYQGFITNLETALNNPADPLVAAFGTNTVDPAIIATAREHLNAFETAFTGNNTATALTAIRDSQRSIASTSDSIEKFSEKTQKSYEDYQKECDRLWNERVDYLSRLQKSSKDVNDVRKRIKRRINEACHEYYRAEIAKLLRLRQEKLKQKPEKKSSINRSYADKITRLVREREKELSMFQIDNVWDIMKNRIEMHCDNRTRELQKKQEEELEEKPENRFVINWHYNYGIKILEQKRAKYILWLDNNQKQQNELYQKRRDGLNQERKDYLSKLDNSETIDYAHSSIKTEINKYFDLKIDELQKEQKEYFPEFSGSDINDEEVRKILLHAGCIGIERAINVYYDRKLKDATEQMRAMKEEERRSRGRL